MLVHAIPPLLLLCYCCNTSNTSTSIMTYCHELGKTMALFSTIKQWPKKAVILTVLWEGELLQWRLGIVNDCNFKKWIHKAQDNQQAAKNAVSSLLCCGMLSIQKWMVRWFILDRKYPLQFAALIEKLKTSKMHITFFLSHKWKRIHVGRMNFHQI